MGTRIANPGSHGFDMGIKKTTLGVMTYEFDMVTRRTNPGSRDVGLMWLLEEPTLGAAIWIYMGNSSTNSGNPMIWVGSTLAGKDMG